MGTSLPLFSSYCNYNITRPTEWPYFDDNVGRGKGAPVDEVDAICKILHEGYECAIRDSEDEGLECEPWTIPYLVGTDTTVTDHELYEHCVSMNPTNMCAARACTVETAFVENMLAYLLSGVGIPYETYAHRNGFDSSTDAGCPVKKAAPGVGASKACCGGYPNRYPFKTLDGDRECCGQRTYQTALLSCCSGNKVKANC